MTTAVTPKNHLTAAELSAAISSFSLLPGQPAPSLLRQLAHQALNLIETIVGGATLRVAPSPPKDGETGPSHYSDLANLAAHLLELRRRRILPLPSTLTHRLSQLINLARDDKSTDPRDLIFPLLTLHLSTLDPLLEHEATLIIRRSHRNLLRNEEIKNAGMNNAGGANLRVAPSQLMDGQAGPAHPTGIRQGRPAGPTPRDKTMDGEGRRTRRCDAATDYHRDLEIVNTYPEYLERIESGELKYSDSSDYSDPSDSSQI